MISLREHQRKAALSRAQKLSPERRREIAIKASLAAKKAREDKKSKV